MIIFGSKSLPAEQRIVEIEEGVIPDVLEILKDPTDIISIGSKTCYGSKKDEILIIFHTANALLRQERAGGMNLLIEKQLDTRHM